MVRVHNIPGLYSVAVLPPHTRCISLLTSYTAYVYKTKNIVCIIHDSNLIGSRTRTFTVYLENLASVVNDQLICHKKLKVRYIVITNTSTLNAAGLLVVYRYSYESQLFNWSKPN